MLGDLTYTQAKHLVIEMGEEYGYWGSYVDLLRALYPVVYSRDFGGYTGEIVAVVASDDAFGLLVCSYGSCSVCDPLQACRDRREVIKLMLDFNKRIRWFPTLDAVADFLESEDAPLFEPFLESELRLVAEDIRAGVMREDA